MTRIELDDGKYTVVHDRGAGLHALRYGEHWRGMTGDGLVLAMAQEIEDLRRRIVPVQQVSVPECFTKLLHHAHGMTMGVDWNTGTMASYHREPLGEAAVQCQAWLAAAPAAPAADAGDVLDQAMYTLISIGYHENSGLVHELRQALAAHRAKGVV